MLAACCHNACHALQKPVRSAVIVHFINKPPADSIMAILSDPADLLNSRKEKVYRITGNYITIEEKLDHPVFLMIDIGDRSLFQYTGYSAYRGMFISPGDETTYEVGDDYDKGILNVNFRGRGHEKYDLLKSFILARHVKIPKLPFNAPVDQKLRRVADLCGLTAKMFSRPTPGIDPETFASLRQSLLVRDIYDGFQNIRQLTDSAQMKAKYKEFISPLIPTMDAFIPNYPDESSLTLREMILTWNRFIRTDLSGNDGLHLAPGSMIKLIEAGVKDPTLQQHLVAFNVKGQLSKKGLPEDFKEEVEGYIARQSVHTVYLQQLPVLVKKYENDLSKGRVAPDFALQDVSGKTVRLKDYIGKTVVLDFFFYGCPGCLQIAPVLDSLEQTYAGKPVVFISISIDRDKATWLKGIGRFSGKHGVQLYTNGEGGTHPVIKIYQVSSYPSLVIIDRQGKIVEAHAPDPRSVSGKAAFTSLIDNAMNN